MAWRSFKESILGRGLLSHRLVLGAVLLIFCVQMAALYLPTLQGFLQTVPWSPFEPAACLVDDRLMSEKGRPCRVSGVAVPEARGTSANRKNQDR